MAKKTLVSSFRPGALQLLTDNPAGGQTRSATLLLEPFGEFRPARIELGAEVQSTGKVVATFAGGYAAIPLR